MTNTLWSPIGSREESESGSLIVFIVFAVVALALSSISFAGASSGFGKASAHRPSVGASACASVGACLASPEVKLPVRTVVNDVAQDEPTHLASFAGKTKVLERRIRIQRIVMGLDRIEDATMQMMPENEDRLHPILEDLQDRAVALSDMEKISASDVDEELTQIEVSVKKLSNVVARMVQPEMTL